VAGSHPHIFAGPVAKDRARNGRQARCVGDNPAFMLSAPLFHVLIRCNLTAKGMNEAHRVVGHGLDAPKWDQRLVYR
jgi:hypothetical protein